MTCIEVWKDEKYLGLVKELVKNVYGKPIAYRVALPGREILIPHKYFSSYTWREVAPPKFTLIKNKEE